MCKQSLSVSGFQLAQSSLQGELVALGAEPADNPAGEVGKIAVVAEGLARVHVRQVNLDEGDGHPRQGMQNTPSGNCHSWLMSPPMH